jgi:hypothetical protein
VRNRVDHDVEDDRGEDTVAADKGEERLSLPADSNLSLSVVGADVFA